MIDRDDEAGIEGSGIGATDQFFSLAAVLIVLLCLLSQGFGGTLAASGRGAERDIAALSGLWLAQVEADRVVLHRPGSGPETVPLDDILSGGAERWAVQAGGPLWLVIAAEARDSAFLLDTALARAGVAEVQRVRLSSGCVRPRMAEAGVICDG